MAELADLSTKDLFRHIADLRARDLVQQRGRWRAVLPHAISNRLAREALNRIPTHLVIEAFVPKERLLKSFSRRLSFLHGCEPAIKIAENWLSDSNWLANPAGLNDLGIVLFHNIAPLVPKQALDAIERAALGGDGAAFLSPGARGRFKWSTLLRSLAYEPELFDRATFLLAHLCAIEPENRKSESVRSTFTELFHLYLSGTRALADQRLSLIRRLLDSTNLRLHDCALDALDAMLEASHFSSAHDFSFGARPRDFGWQPKTQRELTEWFGMALTLVRELSISTSPYRERARATLARHLRALCVHACIPDHLEHVVKELNALDGWPDGWVALRTTIRFDIDRMPSHLAERLRNLEAEVRPRELVPKIRAYVLSRVHGYWDLADGETQDDSEVSHSKAAQRVAQVIEDLGREAANTPAVLTQLLPDLLRQGSGERWQFGRGLAIGATEVKGLWQQLHQVLSDIPERERDISLMQGFISAAADRDPSTANQLLDHAVSDPVLGPFFPLLQASMRIDDSGAQRLAASLNIGLAQAWAYQYLGYGRVADGIPSSAYRRIVLAVGSLPNGFPIAIDLLIMRLYGLKSEKIDVDSDTVGLSRDLLMRVDFEEHNENLAYHVGAIAAVCLRGDDARDAALKLCTDFARALADYRSGAWHYDKLAGVLFQLQPQVALDTLLGSRNNSKRGSLLQTFPTGDETPVNSAAPEVLLAWADQDPPDRYPKLASEVRILSKGDDNQHFAWSPLAARLLERAPDRNAILEIFSSRFRPRGWSGSLADVLTPYLRFARELCNDADPVMAAWARRQEYSLVRQIEEERRQDRLVDERFE